MREESCGVVRPFGPVRAVLDFPDEIDANVLN